VSDETTKLWMNQEDVDVLRRALLLAVVQHDDPLVRGLLIRLDAADARLRNGARGL
jgi:hypothetical protein